MNSGIGENQKGTAGRVQLRWIREGFKGGFLSIRVPFWGDSVRILGVSPAVTLTSAVCNSDFWAEARIISLKIRPQSCLGASTVSLLESTQHDNL